MCCLAVQASATSPEQRGNTVVQADGSLPPTYGKTSTVTPTAYYVGQTDPAWKVWFVDQAIAATVAAWDSLRPAQVAFAEAEVEGLASSRRLLLSDGSWADPRRDPTPQAHIVSRTEVDPVVRVMVLRERGTHEPLAAVINYGTHPWLFCISGFSAELAGATSDRVAATWGRQGTEPPVVLYTTGPQGDATLIWNIDVATLWRTRPGESVEDSLARREKAFDGELERLSGRLTSGVMAAIANVDRWETTGALAGRRSRVALPLKMGYKRPSDVQVAEWQQQAPESQHLTEVQVLQLGDAAIVGLPGEPFTSLGRAIRAQSPCRHLLIAALANEFGAFGYVADREAYGLGGYELTHSPTAPGAGEALVDAAVGLLRDNS